MMIVDKLKKIAATMKWAERQYAKTVREEGHRRRLAQSFPPGHMWKITREAIEWCENLPEDHPWHRAKGEQPPPGTVMVGDLAVMVDSPPALPELEGLQTGPLPKKYRRGESEEERSNRIYEQRFG